MSAISSVNGTPQTDTLQPASSDPIASQSARQSSVVPTPTPTLSDLISSGVSAAFGLSSPPDLANLEVMVSEVLSKYEQIKTVLNENKLVGDSEKMRSVRTLLLASIANREQIQETLKNLTDEQTQRTDALEQKKGTLAQKRTDLENLPKNTPVETPTADSTDDTSGSVQEEVVYQKDPAEVARLEGEIATLEGEIATETASLAELEQRVTAARDLSVQASAAEASLQASVAQLAAANTSKEGGKKDTNLSLDTLFDVVASDLRKAKAEFSGRDVFIQDLHASLQEVADDELNVDMAVKKLAEAEFALQVVGFVKDTVSETLDLANEVATSQSPAGGRLHLLLDRGSAA